MPFIDDELLWCPDNDGKMVDLTQCLQASTKMSILLKFYGFCLNSTVGNNDSDIHNSVVLKKSSLPFLETSSDNLTN